MADDDGDSDEDGLTAGACELDVTPEVGRQMKGYVRPDIKADGVHSRVYVRAVVVEDGSGSKLALVSTDQLTGFDKDDVLEQVNDLGLGSDDVVICGSHTHAAPDRTTWTNARVAECIRRADIDREPAEAAWGVAEVDDVNRNRSLEAHLANHGFSLDPGEGDADLDPEGRDHPRDRGLQVLRVESREGEPIAALCRFSVHPTALPPSNTLYSSDVVGAAVHRFTAEFLDQRGRTRYVEDGEVEEAPVAVFLNGGVGDQITVYDSYNEHGLVDSLGRRLAGALKAAWREAGTALSGDVTVAASSRKVEYRGQEVEPGVRVARKAFFGAPFLGGAENGPSPLHGLGLEGRRRPQLLADEVHGRKIPVAPAPWGPEIEVQVACIDEVALLCVPGEPTVEMGRRCSREALEELPENVSEARVVGLANGYNGYFTTPEEYDRQHYEGGHTVFGRHTEALVRKTHIDLAREIAAEDHGEPADEYHGASAVEDHGEPADEDYRALEGMAEDAYRGAKAVSSGASAPVASGDAEGAIVRSPEDTVERYSVVSMEWRGGRKGRDRPVDSSFIRLEVEEDDGWRTVASDLSPGFVWRVDGRRYTAEYEVPCDAAVGRHRFVVSSPSYRLETSPFEIEPSHSLQLQGASVDEDGHPVFHGQNPSPDPGTSLRSRPRRPEGGTVEFELDGDDYEADLCDYAGAWTAETPMVEDGDVLESCLLTDGDGNSSGEPADLTVGEVEAVGWPDDMETGGGKPPGPFGVGSWPI